jgi:hypothetical protein
MLRRRLAWYGGLILLAACDPAYYMRVSNPLRPAASLACLDSAAAASGTIAVISKGHAKPGHEKFEIRFQEATALPLAASLEFAKGPASDSSVVTSIRYRWIGGSTRLDPGAESNARAQAATVLAELRAKCAPTATPVVECRYEGLRPGNCRAPA